MCTEMYHMPFHDDFYYIYSYTDATGSQALCTL